MAKPSPGRFGGNTFGVIDTRSNSKVNNDMFFVKPATQQENAFFANCSVHSDSVDEYIANSIPNRKKITLHSVEALTVTVTESQATKSAGGVSPEKHRNILFDM